MKLIVHYARNHILAEKALAALTHVLYFPLCCKSYARDVV